jgi:HsdM N-terminal domain
VLWKEAGCTTELDYTEQTSWLLFLKYLDDLETAKLMEAELDGKPYTFILDEPYRWATWAAPKDANGTIDHNKTVTGEDLVKFVNNKLFPYLSGFEQKTADEKTIEKRLVLFLAKSETNFLKKAATTYAISLTKLTACVFNPKLKNTNYLNCTKPRLKTWATQDATAVNITRRAR